MGKWLGPMNDIFAKFAKVMFSQVSVCPQRGACMAGGMFIAGACMTGDMLGGQGCMAGCVCDRGICGRGHA